MKGFELKNHYSLTSCNDVKSICSSILSTIGITYFNYIKIYNEDGSRDLLTTDATWIDHFYQNGLYETAGTVDIEHLLPKGYFLWSELNDYDPIYAQGRESFNIDNGISFVIKRKNVTYLYIFASTRDNTKINNFYIRNVDLLKRFIVYFNDNARPLIKKAEANKIYLPEKRVIRPEKIDYHNLSDEERTSFFEATDLKKYYILSESDDLYLTKKQIQCCAHLSNGATAKQCAKLLNISHRTVESYLCDIKNKIFTATGAQHTKDELISYLKNTGFLDTVFPNIKMKIWVRPRHNVIIKP